MAELFSFTEVPDSMTQSQGDAPALEGGYLQKAVFIKDFGGFKGKVRVTIESTVGSFSEAAPKAPNLDDDTSYTVTLEA